MLEVMQNLWHLLLGPLTLLFAAWTFFTVSGARSDARDLSRLERKLDAIVKHLGIDFEGQIKAKVAELVKGGRKAEAIALYCESLRQDREQAQQFVAGVSKGK